jgi:hypothetical protein
VPALKTHNVHINFRLSADEYAALVAEAKAADKKPAAVAKALVVNRSKPMDPATALLPSQQRALDDVGQRLRALYEQMGQERVELRREIRAELARFNRELSELFEAFSTSHKAELARIRERLLLGLTD